MLGLERLDRLYLRRCVQCSDCRNRCLLVSLRKCRKLCRRLITVGYLDVRQGQNSVAGVRDGRKLPLGCARDIIVHLGRGGDFSSVAAKLHFCHLGSLGVRRLRADLNRGNIPICGQLEAYRLILCKVNLIVRAIVLVFCNACICCAVDKEECRLNSCSCIRLCNLIAELYVLGIALFVLSVDAVILAHRVIDAEAVKPEAIAAACGLIKGIVVEHLHLSSIFAVIKTSDLDNRYLIQAISCIVINDPFVVLVLGVAVVVVDKQILDCIAVLVDGNNYCSGLVIGQADDIKAGALEGKGRGRPCAGFVPAVEHTAIYGNGLCAAHGELTAVLIGLVITVNVLAAKLGKRLLCSFFRAVEFPHRCCCRAGAVLEALAHEAVLIVDIRCGDDLELSVQLCITALIVEVQRDGDLSIYQLLERIGERVPSIPIDDGMSVTADRVIKLCSFGKGYILYGAYVIDAEPLEQAGNFNRQTEVHNYRLAVLKGLDLIVQGQSLAVFGYICAVILIDAALVVIGNVGKLGEVLVECLLNICTVENICIIGEIASIQSSLARPSLFTAYRFVTLHKSCVKGRYSLALIVFHGNLIALYLALRGIVIIHYLKVCVLFDRLKINENELCGVLFRPPNIGGCAVDHRSCSGGLVPDLCLLIPLTAACGRLFLPCYGIGCVPHIGRCITCTRTVRNGDLGYIVIAVIDRSHYADVTLAIFFFPEVEYSSRLAVYLALYRRKLSVGIYDGDTQRNLTKTGGGIGRCAVCAIAPVLGKGGNFLGDLSFLEVVGYKMIIAPEIMPCAVSGLILPCVAIADMSQSSTLRSHVHTVRVGLLMSRIQAHCLPVCYGCVFPVARISGKGRNLNAIRRGNSLVSIRYSLSIIGSAAC